jgi:hypothetical protein
MMNDNNTWQLWFQILPELLGVKINEFFDLVRPIIEFKFETVLARANNIFEVQTVEPIDVLLKVSTVGLLIYSERLNTEHISKLDIYLCQVF